MDDVNDGERNKLYVGVKSFGQKKVRRHLWDAVGGLGVDSLSGSHEHLREVLDVTASFEEL